MSALPDHPNVLRLLGACVRAPLALVTPYCQKCGPPAPWSPPHASGRVTRVSPNCERALPLHA
jgi:hypothetical protein